MRPRDPRSAESGLVAPSGRIRPAGPARGSGVQRLGLPVLVGLLAGVLAAVALAGCACGPAASLTEVTLVRVIDGDTIWVQMPDQSEEKVRYIGIDAPELNTRSPATPDAYAEAATEANARHLAGGRLVLEKDVSERDQYGRLLRNAWLERDGAWTLVNLALVAEGYAQVSTYPPDVGYVDVLLAGQRAAREAGRGLWGGTPP